MDINTLTSMLEKGQDSLILRFGLGQALLKQGDTMAAIEHFLKALEFDAEYSAALKLLGKAYMQSEQTQLAIETYQRGIKIAESKGDIQAAKEMKVFLKRLVKIWIDLVLIWKFSHTVFLSYRSWVFISTNLQT